MSDDHTQKLDETIETIRDYEDEVIPYAKERLVYRDTDIDGYYKKMAYASWEDGKWKESEHISAFILLNKDGSGKAVFDVDDEAIEDIPGVEHVKQRQFEGDGGDELMWGLAKCFADVILEVLGTFPDMIFSVGRKIIGLVSDELAGFVLILQAARTAAVQVTSYEEDETPDALGAIYTDMMLKIKEGAGMTDENVESVDVMKITSELS